MDGDLSHRVRDLSNLLEMKRRLSADLVIGSRWISAARLRIGQGPENYFQGWPIATCVVF